MIIATSMTSDYFRKSQPFFDSVNKNFEGKKICFCIGFTARTIYEGWEMVYVREDLLECKVQGFPENREKYYSLQHGEFVKHYSFKPDDQVLFIDSDMILQRNFRSDLIYPGFVVSNSSFPPTKLGEVYKNLGCKDEQRFLSQFDFLLQEEEFCAALMLASVKEWTSLYLRIKADCKQFLSNFSHHAAWQLLINLIVLNYHKNITVSPMFQNAEWYSGTEAYVKDNKLMWKDEIVYFNHTKFNGNFQY